MYSASVAVSRVHDLAGRAMWCGEHEIDVVGLTEGATLLVGECKFQQSPLGYDALATLGGHVDEFQWTPPEGSPRVEAYALFSRSGFK